MTEDAGLSDQPSSREDSQAREADLNRLLPVVYDELRNLAAYFVRQQDPGLTLGPTSLVHEAYIRLAEHSAVASADRIHFFNLAAKVMRQVLSNHLRDRRALKRGGGRSRMTLTNVVLSADRSEVDLLDLMTALDKLSRLNPRHSEIVTLRFFGGMTVEEVGLALGVSTRTVENDWRMARAWLLGELEEAT